MSNKKKNVDKISHLPDYLLHHILSFLNTKQVVQTCVLSKRWKPVWTHIPTLNFDFNSYPFQGSSSRNIRLKERSFKDFIFMVLSRHCGLHIQKLSYTASCNDDERNLTGILICYARIHMVRELCIDSSDLYDCFDLKWCFLEYQSLTVLKMSVGFMSDWEVLVLPSLRSLEVESDWSKWDFDTEYKGTKILSGCPNLESLVLVDYLRETFSISTPKLVNFELRSSSLDLTFPEVELCTSSLTCVKFKNILPSVKCDSDLPYLEKVNIALEDYLFRVGRLDTQKFVEHLFELLQRFHNATSLILPLEATKVLLSASSLLSGSFLFHNLRHLKLKTEGTNKVVNLPISLWAYFQKCPTLETLLVDLN